MNTEQANRIPLSEILQNLGCTPVKEKGRDAWYNSPFREEKTASFHVHEGRNVWYDFGIAKGGTSIDFVCHYLEVHGEDHTVQDALRWLRNMHPTGVAAIPDSNPIPKDEIPALELKKISSLQNEPLVKYLYARGIAPSVGKKYLKQAYVFNRHTGKHFYALALKNENGGYELRNKIFKGCIAPKTFSFVRGTTLLPLSVHVFEGIMDYLAALAYEKTDRLDGDAVILNSLACLPQALGYMRHYSYKVLCTWLDNDPAGVNATHILRDFAKDHRFTFSPKNEIYVGHKDLNAWHMHRLEK
jgi:hypothetical protein